MSGAKADPHYEMRANRARTKAIVLSSLLHGPVATKHALHAYFYTCVFNLPRSFLWILSPHALPEVFLTYPNQASTCMRWELSLKKVL